MNNSSLPTEILAIIVEDFISEYQCTDSPRARLIPRWYLTPLLRVSKLWNALCTKHLYRSIAIGSAAPFEFSARQGESTYQTNDRRRLLIATRRMRKGHKVAKDLYGALSSDSRLAAFVERLQLGMEPVRYYQRPEWTQTNIGILKLCPNVQHVEVRGFEESELDNLVDALKEKSLVSFCITPRHILDTYRRAGGSFFQICDMMRRWPMLRSIRVEDFLTDAPRVIPVTLDTSQVSGCCPDLREIIITGASLDPSELEIIRTMCSGGVTKFSIAVNGRVSGSGEAAALDGLCDCLRAWSPTLQYLKIDVRNYSHEYPALEKVIATLRELRELQVTSWMKLGHGSISNLPWLERFASLTRHKLEDLGLLLSNLEDSEKLPSLNHIVLCLEPDGEFPNKLQTICSKRNIQLEEGRPEQSLTADFLL